MHNMTAVTISTKELKKAIEHKAYAFGVSEAVSTLLGEYVVELIRTLYAKPTEQLVQKPL